MYQACRDSGTHTLTRAEKFLRARGVCLSLSTMSPAGMRAAVGERAGERASVRCLRLSGTRPLGQREARVFRGLGSRNMHRGRRSRCEAAAKPLRRRGEATAERISSPQAQAKLLFSRAYKPRQTTRRLGSTRCYIIPIVLHSYALCKKGVGPLSWRETVGKGIFMQQKQKEAFPIHAIWYTDKSDWSICKIVSRNGSSQNVCILQHCHAKIGLVFIIAPVQFQVNSNDWILT